MHRDDVQLRGRLEVGRVQHLGRLAPSEALDVCVLVPLAPGGM